MKKTVWLAFILLAGNTYAQKVSFPEAEKVARTYLCMGKNSKIKYEAVCRNHRDTLYSIFSSESAFVVISGNKNCIPVLAFSYSNTFDAQSLTPPVKMWLDHYESQLNMMAGESFINPKYNKEWAEMLGEEKSSKELFPDEIKPFLLSRWGQGEYFNFYCPQEMNGPNGRTVTGCVATAMAQILHYYRFPESGTGSYTYTHPQYGVLSADFENSTYDYSKMPDRPSYVNAAAGRLIRDLGIAVDMDYGANASGMYNHKAAYALKTYFKFSPSTQYIFRDSTIVNWDSLIVDHLKRHLPLYYAGWSVPHTEGHAFICDGYKRDQDSNFYYHFNFGWDGHYDGYFYTGSLSPGGSNFNLAQELVINAYPDTSLYPYPSPNLTGRTVITSEEGSFEDGSGPLFPYFPGMDFTWQVIPEVDTLYSISFSLEYQLGDNDTLYIESDDPHFNSIWLTSDSSSIELETFGTHFTVRFTTEDIQKNAAGFKCHYTTHFPLYCTRTELHTAREGIIEDGSGDRHYNNCSRCENYIRITGVSTITFTFEEFDTEANEDILYIYDMNTYPVTLMAQLSGTLPDSAFTFHTNKINLCFETSSANTFPGWKLKYTSDEDTGIENREKGASYSFYPNPVQEEAILEITEWGSEKISGEMVIYDLYGKRIRQEKITGERNRIQVSDISSGIYFLQIHRDDGAGEVIKFIKN